MYADAQSQSRYPDTGVRIDVRSVDLDYSAVPGSHWVLRQVSLSAAVGEFIAILGPSGCGKSTLLNLVAGLLKPTAGEVCYEGTPVQRVNTRVGYVTQRDNLLPWRTVSGNVSLPLEVKGMRRSKARPRVDQMLQLVGLTGFENYYPHRLSGGMRKRASLARTLIYATETWLMDEPFAALDAQLKFVLQGELLHLWESFRTTVLFVTHDIAEALSLADRIVVMASDPGRVIKVMDVPFDRPRDLLAIRRSPEYLALQDKLWGLLSHAGSSSNKTTESLR